MASSVAAMPHESASWRDTTPAARTFFNTLVTPPPHQQEQPPPSSSSPAEVAPTPRRQILDRWAAPAPRRAGEAELCPAPARAAAFREPSPAPSDAPPSSSCAAASVLPPPSGPRASSLIQRWREIEAVGPATPRDAPASDSEPGCRVGSIVKRLSGPSSLPEDDLLDDAAGPPPSPRCATVNGLRPPHLLVRTVRGRRAVEELVANMAHRRSRELAALADRLVVSRFAHKGRIQSMLRLRLLHQGGKVEDDISTLLRPLRPQQPKHVLKDDTTRNNCRKSDIGDANSCSQHNNGNCTADEQRHNRVPPEQKSIGVSVESVVNCDGSGNLHCDELMKTTGNHCQKDHADFVVHSQKYSETSSFARYDEQSTVDGNPSVEDVTPSTTSTLCELETPSSRGDNLQEDNQSIIGSWEERGLWMRNFGWPAPIDSMIPDSWHQDAMGEIENHSQIEFNDRPWIDSPNSWRSLCVSTQLDCSALSRNADICNLLESKKVSKSLESDFSNKMNHLLRTVLHKQRQQRIMDDFGGYYDERMYWRQNDQIQNTEHVVSAPCSLDPVSHLAAHPQETWQRSSIGSQHHDNRNFLEMEVRVRGEVSQIHHEIYELQKLVESCIASQVKMQHSIKEEVCSALREAGLMRSQHDSTAKRVSCCICQRMQVDSLLYRCGHMCTCFNCADQLKSSSRSCPICQSPIDDVVRAQMNF